MDSEQIPGLRQALSSSSKGRQSSPRGKLVFTGFPFFFLVLKCYYYLLYVYYWCFAFMYVRVPRVYIATAEVRWSIGLPGTGVTDGCRLSCGWQYLDPGSLEEQPSLQPHNKEFMIYRYESKRSRRQQLPLEAEHSVREDLGILSACVCVEEASRVSCRQFWHL